MSHSPNDWIPPETEEKRDRILKYATKHGALNLRLFSHIGADDPPADANLFLVRMGPGRLRHDVTGLRIDLRNLLDSPVVIVCESNLPDDVRLGLCQLAVPLT